MKRHLLIISLLTLGLALSAAAQVSTPTATDDVAQDFFKINYFSNNGVAGAPDATVRIDNPGTTDSDLCALIYVFDNDQQLTECCGCLVTPNGLRTLSVGKNLTNNPLTGVVSNNGVIKMVSALFLGSRCDPTGATDIPVVPAIRAWASHVQNKVGTAYPITETEFTNATLSTEEFDFNLLDQCAFAQRLGSGHAVCSCGTGD